MLNDVDQKRAHRRDRADEPPAGEAEIRSDCFKQEADGQRSCKCLQSYAEIPPFLQNITGQNKKQAEPIGVSAPQEGRESGKFVFIFERVVLHQKFVAAVFHVIQILVQVDPLVFHIEQAARDVGAVVSHAL